MRSKYRAFLLLICLALWIPCQVQSEIIECKDLTEAQSYIDSESLVFCEIDDVLLRGTTYASQVPFFAHLKEELLQEGYESEQIANKLYPLWVKVLQIAHMEIQHVDVLPFLETLKSKNIPTFGLSYRGPRLAYKTLDELHHHELYLDLYPPFYSNHIFDPQLFVYYEGLLLLHPLYDKGKALVKFFEHMSHIPQKVVVIDSELIHLVDLQNTLEDHHIDFTGIYLPPKEELGEREIAIGKMQLNYLDKILPDQMANCLLSTRPKL